MEGVQDRNVALENMEPVCFGKQGKCWKGQELERWLCTILKAFASVNEGNVVKG